MQICHFCERIFCKKNYSECRLRPAKDLLEPRSSDPLPCTLCQLFRTDLLAVEINNRKSFEEYEIAFEHTQAEHDYARVPILQVGLIPRGQIGSLTRLGEVLYRSYTVEEGSVSKIVEGRIVARDASSDTALARMSNLVGKHSSACKCSTSDAYPVLPKRVLDLEPKNHKTHLRVIETKGQRAHYAALSHCWGFNKFTTTVANLSDRLVGILVGDMPKAFQDAVSVTRNLGLRFLWIDSLCIIRKILPKPDMTESDWTKLNAENEPARRDFAEESAKMGDYYGNSVITIAADCSSDDGDGFLRQRVADHRSDNSADGTFYEDELQAFDCTIDGERRQIYLHKIKDYGYHMPQRKENDPVQTEILQNRAWKLQERLLPQRILHFGKQQNYLEDHEAGYITFEDGISHPFSQFSEKLYHKEKALCFEAWYSMIEQFKTRKITYPSDTLPAISGLARRAYAISKDQYLAGLWKNDLTRGLLWTTSSGGEPSEPGKKAPSCTAPSWSWASAPGSCSIFA